LSCAKAFLIALLLSLPLPALSAEIPGEMPGGIRDWFDLENSPFIPIPEVGTDPNAGTTLGLLPVVLETDDKRQIRRIYAPDILIDPELGIGADFRVFSYPSADTQWYAVAGGKEHIERNLDLSFETGIQRQGSWSASSRLLYDRTASYRFFGFGNTSGHETNYTGERAYLEGRLGRNLSPALQLALDIRPRWLQAGPGGFAGLPSIESRFPGVPGLGANHEFLIRGFLTYDSRDFPDIPGFGSLLTAYAGTAQSAFLSGFSYSLFGFDLRHYERLSESAVLALHAAARYTIADSGTPFWALASLGGESSIIGENQTLRGFGADRFIDRNLFSANIELRQRLFSLDLFSTRISVEAAPFLDAGQVFHRLDQSPFNHPHVAGGLGFRAVASPFIVGYVDVGFGTEGGAVFSGLDYPF